MKLIALALSIIILVLVSVPCCAFEGGVGHVHTIKTTEKEGCNEQKDDCCNDCPPFYVCGTCIGFTITPQQVISFNVPLKPGRHTTTYVSVGLSNIPASIWQPPKNC